MKLADHKLAHRNLAHRIATPPISAPDVAASMWRPSPIYFVLAFGLAVGAGFFLWTLPEWDTASAPPTMIPALAAPIVRTTVSVTVAAQSLTTPNAKPNAHVQADTDPTRDISAYIMRGENPTMPEVIARLQKAGVYGGLAAFSPPGTRPPLIGLAVPEDFVLPAGFVRHHQATDDGQRIEAILMFAPDRTFLDAANKPIVLPKDRVVPPEYAPPGMPIRRITLPASAATSTSARP